ncbi:acyl-CoA dehydrogenase family protein [Chloroflexota bacterium]
MDFSLTEEQKMLQQRIKEFARKELEPLALEMEEREEFPMENFKKLAALGYAGATIPEKYGGSGLDKVSYSIAIEEISRACPSTGGIFSTLNSLVCENLHHYASEEQRQKYLIPLAKGEKIGAFGLTEANAGSDASSLETTAAKDGDDYLLNGSKIFITNGAEADVIIVFATIDRGLGYKGITAFIVEKDSSDLSIGRKFKKAGMRACTQHELVFKDCRVPAVNRIDEEGSGFRIALGTIDMGRIGIASQGVGIARGAYETALAYAKERQQFGQAIADFQAIQWMLVDMATKVDAARLLTHRAAYMMDQDLPFSKEAAMAKLYATETASEVGTKAVQILGGVGYMTDSRAQMYWRAAKLTEIYEGTSEIQRLVIAREILRENLD